MEDSNIHRKDSIKLCQEISKSLYDDTLMQKYGTSIEFNMGREYTQYLDDRYLKLKKEFNKINKNSDDFIDIDELYEFVNIYSNEVNFIIISRLNINLIRNTALSYMN